MLFIVRKLSLIILLFAVAPGASGHHSFAEFATQASVTLDGIVDEVRFEHPHVLYSVRVINDDGSMDVWDIYAAAPSVLLEIGWTEDSIRPGDRAKFVGRPSRDGALRLLLDLVLLPDGTTLPRG
jgi:hypothetical protein